MAYTVLARRYRSTTFDEVIGQAHVAQTLKRAIESDRIAHAFLFCGTRGTGKTSMARIMAKALNCQATEGPNPNPCNKCNSCLAIARGDDMSVIEIDAASNTGVDDIRAVIENAYTRAPGRFKIYIIDEVHMLSKNAFNALLKTLEEPPSHVKFILATTEPEKVLPTILSRCQRYDFRNIPTREIAGHLKNVCKSEKIKADEDALLLVAKAGAGSMRDALSLLDRLLSIGEKHLTVDTIEQLLGMPKSQVIFDLAGAIGAGDIKAVLESASTLINGGLSSDALCAALIDHLRNLLILRAVGPANDIVDIPGLNPDDLLKQANTFDVIALSQDIAILEELRRSLRTSQAGRALIDATLVRLAMAEQFLSVDSALAGDASGAPALKKKYEPAVIETPLPVLRGRLGEDSASPVNDDSTVAENDPLPASPGVPGEGQDDAATTTVAASSGEDDDDDLPAVGKVWEETGGPSLSEMLKQQERDTSKPAAREATNLESVDVNDFQQVMTRLQAAIPSPGIAGLLKQGRLVQIAEGIATFGYSSDNANLTSILERNGKKQVIQDELSKIIGSTVGVRFVTEESDDATLSLETRSSDARMQAATPPVNGDRKPLASARPAATPAASPAMSSSSQAPAIRITNELREELRQRDPIIKFLIDDLKAEIVRVEAADS